MKKLKVFISIGILLCVFLNQAGTLSRAFPAYYYNWSCPMGEPVDLLDISNDGQYILAKIGWGAVQYIYLFQHNSSTPLWNYTPGTLIYDIAISGNGEYIVMGSDQVYLFHRNSSIPLWNASMGSYVAHVDISSDGQYIVAGSDYLASFHRNNATPMWMWGVAIPIRALAITCNGNWVMTSISPEPNPRVFRFNNTNGSYIYQYLPYDVAETLAVSDDGNHLIVGGQQGTLYYYCYFGLNWRFDSIEAWSAKVDISSDGQYIAAVSDDLYLFNRTSMTPLWYVDYTYTGSVSISRDGQYIVASDKIDGIWHVYLYHRNSSTPLWEYSTGSRVVISGDGHTVAAGGGGNVVHLFDFKDTDDDSLSDYYEVFFTSTNPMLSDTDADGLNDTEELYIYATNATNPDTDADGLNDTAEVLIYLTNATNPDTDYDYMPDYYEIQHSLNPNLLVDAILDNDEDGLINLEEYFHQTDPNKWDSDEDGYSDGLEVRLDTDPLDKNSFPNSVTLQNTLLNLSILIAGIIIVVSVIAYRKRSRPRPAATAEL